MGTKSLHIALVYNHTWVIPTYFCDKNLQNDQKIPRWETHSWRGQYIGESTMHSWTIGLFNNIRTDNIIFQFNVVYYYCFKTVDDVDADMPTCWP